SLLVPAMTIFPLRLLVGVVPGTVVSSLQSQIDTLIRLDPDSGQPRGEITIELLESAVLNDWHFTGAIYQLDQAPSWMERLQRGAEDPRAEVKAQFRQHNWHLALVGVTRPTSDFGWVAVHATQDSIAALLREWLIAGRFGDVRTS